MRKRLITVRVELLIPQGMTKVQAKREVRTRINELCGHHTHIRHRGEVHELDTGDVRAKRVS